RPTARNRLWVRWQIESASSLLVWLGAVETAAAAALAAGLEEPNTQPEAAAIQCGVSWSQDSEPLRRLWWQKRCGGCNQYNRQGKLAHQYIRALRCERFNREGVGRGPREVQHPD